MKRLLLCSITYVFVFAILMFHATPVFAETSTGSLSLEGNRDSDTIVLTVTKEFNLYSYGSSDDVNFQAYVELSDRTPSYSVTLDSYNYSQSYYYDKSVDYTYIVSDSQGSTYYDSLKAFDYVTGPYFTVTCVATITVSSNSSTPADYAALYNATLNFSPTLSSVYASDSLEYQNNLVLDEISTELDGVKDELVEANTELDEINSELQEVNTELDNVSSELEDVNGKLDELIERTVSSSLGNGYDVLTFGADTDVYLVNRVTGDTVSMCDAGTYININKVFPTDTVATYLSFFTSDSNTNNRGVPIGYQSPGNYLFMWGLATESVVDVSGLAGHYYLYHNNELVLRVRDSSFSYSSTFYNGLYYYVFYIQVPDVDVYFDSVRTTFEGFSEFSPVSVHFMMCKDNGTISDLMDYLEDKWENGYTVDSSVTDAKDNADVSIDNVESVEQEYFAQYDAAYANAGISDFKLATMGNQFAFVQSIVNTMWNNMPATLQFLFYAVLVLGVFALIVSVGGRIAKRARK